MPLVLSVNVASGSPNPADSRRTSGIDKRPTRDPVDVRDPGPKGAGAGSGLVGDLVADGRHHGGSTQAVYAYAREDFDFWAGELGRSFAPGAFGENLTTLGMDVTTAVIGERWLIGPRLQLQVTAPRIPCATFAARMREPRWVRTFTAANRPGAYLRVLTAGPVRAGDPIKIVHRPAHGVTLALTFRATTREPELLDRLLAAGNDLDEETRQRVEQRRPIELDDTAAS